MALLLHNRMVRNGLMTINLVEGGTLATDPVKFLYNICWQKNNNWEKQIF